MRSLPHAPAQKTPTTHRLYLPAHLVGGQQTDTLRKSFLTVESLSLLTVRQPTEVKHNKPFYSEILIL